MDTENNPTIEQQIARIEHYSLEDLQRTVAFEKTEPEVHAAMVKRLAQLKKTKQATEDAKLLAKFASGKRNGQQVREYIWQGFIERMRITGIVSESPEAASRFVIDVAARFTVSAPWIDGTKPHVIVDGKSYDIDPEELGTDVVLVTLNPKARELFEQAGGDSSKLHTCSDLRFYELRQKPVKRGAPKYEQVLIDADEYMNALSRQEINPGLFIFDPVSQAAESALNHEHLARAALEMMRGFGTVIFTLGASKRSASRKAVGTNAWVDTPACVLNITEGPSGVKHVEPVRGGGVAFSYRAGGDGKLITVDPSEVAEAQAEQSEGKSTKTDSAAAWLRGVLRDGREWYRADLMAAAVEDGIKEDQLERASTAIGVIKKRAREEGARGVWYLPKPSAGVR
jgi:hypothetical protein